MLSRFWYLALAAAASAAAVAAVLAVVVFNRQYDEQVDDQLRRDDVELALRFGHEAGKHLDAITPMAASPDVRSALRAASNRRDGSDIDPKLQKRLESKLGDLNHELRGLAGDLVFAVDSDGTIVAQIGAETVPKGSGIGRFPLVHRALSGYSSDDTWLWNGGVYRMVARPVIDGGRYVGAIVHGKKVDDELAKKLSEGMEGASIGFFSGDHIIAASAPAERNAPGAQDLAQPLAKVLADPALAKDGHTEPVAIGETGRALYSLVTGEAAAAHVGYVVGRPRVVLASPFDIFKQASKQDVKALHTPMIIVGAVGFVLFLLGLAFMWLERDRPFKRLRSAIDAVGNQPSDRLTITDFGGRYRKLAESINEAIDKAVEQAAAMAPKRKSVDVGEILGPPPTAGGGGGYFGFADTGRGQAEDADIPAVPAAPPPAAPAAPASAKAAPPPPAPGPRPAAHGAPARPAPPAPGPKPSGPALGGPAPRPPAAPMPPAANPPKPAPVAPAAPAAARHSPVTDDDEEGATMVNQVPEELLAAAAGAPSQEEQHFREVFDQFVAKKKACGEATAGLTYDKFSQTLRKNRDQIVSRHGVTGVRFTVYVKEGKAALRATPVK